MSSAVDGASAQRGIGVSVRPQSGFQSDLERLRKKFQAMGVNTIIAGATAGIGSKLILQPLDLVKTRMQVQTGAAQGEYRGVAHAFRTITASEGFLGLYRGLSPNLVGSGVSWGLYYFVYNASKREWRKRQLPGSPVAAPGVDTSEMRLSAGAHLACAAGAGAFTVVFTNPIWLVKTRMQIQGREGLPASQQYRGLVHALTSIARQDGFLSLYRGMAPALLLVSNGALQFMAYEELRDFATRHVPSDKQLNAGHFLAMGALSKVFSSTATFPLAVTRSRLYQRKPAAMLQAQAAAAAAAASAGAGAQVAVKGATDALYSGMGDAVRTVWAREGWRGFYRGLGPHLLKTGPASSINWCIFELVTRWLDRDPRDRNALALSPAAGSAASGSAALKLKEQREARDQRATAATAEPGK